MAVQDHHAPFPEIFRQPLHAFGLDPDAFVEAGLVAPAAAQPDRLGENLSEMIIESFRQLLDIFIFTLRETAGQVDRHHVRPVTGDVMREPCETSSPEVMELQRKALDGP